MLEVGRVEAPKVSDTDTPQQDLNVEAPKISDTDTSQQDLNMTSELFFTWNRAHFGR
jgi:hypothetical protein